jgi:hypothetical protein
MAQLKKRTTVAKTKSTARSKTRKGSVAARGKAAAKQHVAKANPRKGFAKSTTKSAAAKKTAPKRARQVKRPSTPTVETVTVDVFEESAPGVVTITEFEQTEVRGTLGESEQQ